MEIEQKEFEDEKSLYDNYAKAAKQMGGKLKKAKVSELVDSDPFERLDGYFTTLKGICKKYHKQATVVFKKFIELQKLKSELIKAKMNNLLKIADTAGPELVEKPLEQENLESLSRLKEDEKIIDAMHLELGEISEMKSYWKKEIQTILNQNTNN